VVDTRWILGKIHRFHRTFPTSCLVQLDKAQSLKVFGGNWLDDNQVDGGSWRVDLCLSILVLKAVTAVDRGPSILVLEAVTVEDRGPNTQALVVRIGVAHGDLRNLHLVETNLAWILVDMVDLGDRNRKALKEVVRLEVVDCSSSQMVVGYSQNLLVGGCSLSPKAVGCILNLLAVSRSLNLTEVGCSHYRVSMVVCQKAFGVDNRCREHRQRWVEVSSVCLEEVGSNRSLH
jgi:hypothetical protein